MHDFISAQLSLNEIERGLTRNRNDKLDPDGLSQYDIWDEAFSHPSLMDRIRKVATFFRMKKSLPSAVVARQEAIECLPQV